MQPRKSTSSDPNISEKLGPKMASSSSTVTDRFSTQGGADIIGDTGDSSGPGPQIMAADTLEGNNVVNREGETLGEIKNIMIDVLRGRVAYAVLSFGGFLGVGDKLFAIPWRALTLDADNHNFVLDVPKQYLQDAPGFDKDHWPTMVDLRWATQLHSYYETRPYWER